jgi:FixJ family two-component response regulator
MSNTLLSDYSFTGIVLPLYSGEKSLMVSVNKSFDVGNLIKMKPGGSIPIFILDDEQSICTTMTNIILALGMKPESATSSEAAISCIKRNCYDIVFLDVLLSDGNGLDLIPDIKKYAPETLIIVMSGYADKEMAVQALRSGAFDFLEKPFGVELLSHTINRALKALEADRKVKALITDLEEKKAELLVNKERLEALNSRLIETNRALSVLAQNIEREREEIEKRVALRLKSHLHPVIEKLQRDEQCAPCRFRLDLLVRQMEDLTSGFSPDAKLAAALSFSELRVASLIKNGLSTEDIADHLNISYNTVRTHRKNIRKKLGISNSQYSLRNYLSSKRSSSN